MRLNHDPKQVQPQLPQHGNQPDQQPTSEDILGTPDLTSDTQDSSQPQTDLSQESVPADLNGDVGSPATPDLAKEGNRAVNAGLGIQKNLANDQSSAVLEGLNNQGKINAIGAAGASQSHDRKYDSVASQKIYDDLNAQNQAQQAQRQKLSESLVGRGLTLQKAPGELASQSIKNKIAQSQANVEAGTEGAQVEAAQAKAKGAELQNEEIQQKIDLINKNAPQQAAKLKAETDRMVAEADSVGSLDKPMGSKAAGLSTLTGIPAADLAKMTPRIFGEYVKGQGMQFKQGVQNNKEGAAIQKTFQNDKVIQEAQKGLAEAKGLESTPEGANQISDHMKAIQAAKASVSQRLNMTEIQKAEVSDLYDRMVNTLSLNTEGSLSDEARNQYNAYSQQLQKKYQDILNERADALASSSSAVYKNQSPEKIKSIGNPVAGVKQNEMVTIQDSQGGKHQLPRASLDAAKKRDPGLKVIGE